MSPPSEETVDEDVALVASLTGLRANHNLREREREREWERESGGGGQWGLAAPAGALTPHTSRVTPLVNSLLLILLIKLKSCTSNF